MRGRGGEQGREEAGRDILGSFHIINPTLQGAIMHIRVFVTNPKTKNVGDTMIAWVNHRLLDYKDCINSGFFSVKMWQCASVKVFFPHIARLFLLCFILVLLNKIFIFY